MLPINHLIRTLIATGKDWELLTHTSSSDVFTSALVIDGLTTTVTLLGNRWYTLSTERHSLSSLLNGEVVYERDDAGNLPSDFACVPGVE